MGVGKPLGMKDVHTVERCPIARVMLLDPSTSHRDDLVEKTGDARIPNEIPKELLGSTRLHRQERMEVSVQHHAGVVVPGFFTGPGLRCAHRNQHSRSTRIVQRCPQEYREKPIEVPKFEQRQCLDEPRCRVKISPGPMSGGGSFLPLSRVEVHVSAE